MQSVRPLELEGINCMQTESRASNRTTEMAPTSDDVAASNRHILHALPPPTLPDHLIMEILQWLPVKNLLQLCCVCKSWKSLISEPYFAKKQLRRSPTHLIFSFKNDLLEFIFQVYPHPKVFDALPVNGTEFIFQTLNCMIGTCDGIICFAVKQHPGILVLWNPCIRKYKMLPLVVSERRRGRYTTYGFGYDSSAHTYKVVTGISYECDCVYKTEVKVLTLGTDTWKRIGDFPSLLPINRSGKFVSGTLNWLAFKSNDTNSCVIISLDLEKESYEEVLQPDYGQESAVDALSLRVLRDCLSIICHKLLFLDVWVMKDFGKKESWTKLFRIPFLFVQHFPFSNLLCISEDNQILLAWESKFLVYNSRNHVLKIPQIPTDNRFLTSELYVESLMSPCT